MTIQMCTVVFFLYTLNGNFKHLVELILTILKELRCHQNIIINLQSQNIVFYLICTDKKKVYHYDCDFDFNIWILGNILLGYFLL